VTRTLVLMRHGKSDYPPGVDDHQRPLNNRGRREAALAGQWLRRDGIAVDVVLCSTANRTRQTLQRTGVEAPAQFLDELYDADADQVCEAVRLHVPADAATVLVVAHFPGMPETALALDPSGRIERFPTSAYAVLEIAAPWDRLGMSPDDSNRLVAMQVPRA